MEEENNLEKTEEYFDSIPPEVKDYIYGDEFTSKVRDFCIKFGIDSSRQTLLTGALYGYIVSAISEIDFMKSIELNFPEKTQQDTIKKWVKEEVVTPLTSLITNAYLEEDVDDETEEEKEEIAAEGSVEKSTSEETALTQLADRLSKPTVILPSKRDYSLEKGDEKPETPQTPIKKFDPYHEVIEE